MTAHQRTSPADSLAEVDGCDFIDFGCKTGGSIHISEGCLGGKRGLGIDLNPVAVATFREGGGRAIVGDVTALQLPDKCVRFVTISHVLEHLPSMQQVGAAVREAARVATDFVVVIGPFFDEDKYLNSIGYKFFWADWVWHPTHVDSASLAGILDEAGLSSATSWGRYPVLSTADKSVHPLGSPCNQQKYDPSLHPTKGEEQKFDRPLYMELVCVVALRPLNELDEMLRKLKVAAPLGPYSQLDVLYRRYWKG